MTYDGLKSNITVCRIFSSGCGIFAISLWKTIIEANFCDPTKVETGWRQGGSFWGLLFSLYWSCVSTLWWSSVTLMDNVEFKKMRQWWGPSLVQVWHMISYLYVLLYEEPAPVPLRLCLVSEDLWAVLQSADTQIPPLFTVTGQCLWLQLHE